MQRVLDQAPTSSVAQYLRRCLSGLVNAGPEEGPHLLARQNLLRGVHWLPADAKHPADEEPADRGITEAEIPSVGAIHGMAAAAGLHNPAASHGRIVRVEADRVAVGTLSAIVVADEGEVV